MTSRPRETSPLITRMTAFSLPGMAREEKMTRSPGEKRHLRMIVLGDTGERGARLALAAGTQRHDFVGRQIAEDLGASGNPRCRRDSRSRVRPGRSAPSPAPPARHRGRRQPPPPQPSEGDRHETQMSSPRPGRSRADQLGQRFGHVALRRRAPLAHRIGRVARQRETAFIAQRTQVSARRCGGPSTGVGSIFQSPV